MKIVALVLCAVPVVAMDRAYQPMVEMEAVGELGDIVKLDPESVIARYSQVQEILFSPQGEVASVPAEYIGRRFISQQNEDRFKDAISDLVLALRANHKPALLDAAQLALSDLSMTDYEAIIPAITPCAKREIGFKSQNNLPESDIVGLRLLTHSDVLTGDYDSKKLALQKITILQNWIARKKDFYKELRTNKIACKQMTCCLGACLVGTGVGMGFGAGCLAVEACAIGGVGIIGTALGCVTGGFCVIHDGAPINRYFNKTTPDKFIEVENVVSEILQRNPEFFTSAVAELETVAGTDKRTAALLQTVYDKGWLVQRDEAKASRYAQLAQPVSEPHAETAA